MSFWNKLGELALKTGSYALKEARAASERSVQYSEEMPEKNDHELISIIKKEHTSSPLKASAAYKELKNRGYEPEDIKKLTA